MAHRPPLPRLWYLYCVVAFLAPPVLMQLIGSADVPYRDLVWLLTLVPAFLLSLQYGMRGAVAGLVMGTVLFTVIQFLVAFNLDPEDWRVTVPIYVAYSAIAISVGWLSEQLHAFYERAIQGERVEVISQVAVAIRHEINNALATMLAEAQILEASGNLTSADDRDSVKQIIAGVRRVRDAIDKLSALTDAPPTISYLVGTQMIDLGRLRGGGPT